MDDLTYRVLTACRGELIGLYPGWERPSAGWKRRMGRPWEQTAPACLCRLS